MVRCRAWTVFGSVLGSTLVGCTGTVALTPQPTAPTVTVINPPTLVRLGQTTSLTAQLFLPRGAPLLPLADFLEVQVVNPSGLVTNRLVLTRANVPGCGPAALQCQTTLSFGPATLPLGTWNLTLTVFDQFGQPGGRQVAITVVP